ncbi:MAG: hypothetical protein IJK61_03700 [Bacteroidetes bacterium]|nr:hypothetical protein [Bacteroidota bacterium]
MEKDKFNFDTKKKEDEKEKEIIKTFNINIKDFIKFLKENNIKFIYKNEMKVEDLQRIFNDYLKD